MTHQIYGVVEEKIIGKTEKMGCSLNLPPEKIGVYKY
jgi:hypothetical protein